MPEPELSATPTDKPLCSVCGTPLRSGAGALCPRCLLNLASASAVNDAGEGMVEALRVRSFGDYELLEEIARGGMGVVFRARQISLGREVAVKMILAGELAGKAVREMFRNEATAAANLHHPNIVPVYETGEHEMQHYFTMRLVPGGRNIAQWAAALPESGRLRSTAQAVGHAARAVAHAHERGVLHRDLKPSNILWDEGAGPQVTDFGLAKLMGSPDGTWTRGAEMLGSPSYMAPEQTGGRLAEITTLTDVYGLGAVLYELLSGRPPFAGKSAVSTARMVAEQPPPPLVNVPRDLRTIAFKCLEKNPADRFASAAALADDLERYVRGEPVLAVPLPAVQRLWRWARRKPALATLTVLCIASLIAGVAGVIWQWRKTEHARAEQAKALAHLQWQEIGHWLDKGESARALAYLASLVRGQPDRWQAAMYAMSIVDQNAFPLLTGPEIHPPVKFTVPARLAPDGSWLAAAGEDNIVRVWDAASGKQTAQLPQKAPVSAIAVSAGPVVLAIATQDGALTIHSGIAAAPASLTRALPSPILSLRFSADGSMLLARSKERVEVWRSAATGQPPLALTLENEVKGAGIAADGVRVLVWNAKQTAVWDTASGKELLRVTAGKDFRGAAIAASGRRVSCLDGGYTARTWDVASGQSFPAVESPLAARSWLALDAAGTRLTLAGWGNDLTVHDVESGLLVSPPMQHNYQVMSLTASPDGSHMFSFGWDEMARVWDADTGRSSLSPIRLERVLSNSVVDPSHDGRRLLVHSPAKDGLPETITVWHRSGQSAPLRHTVAGQRDFHSGSLSPDGRLGTLGLWPGNRSYVYELATGKVLVDQAVAGDVYAHLFSPDMRRCYALTANGWLYGWSLETGGPLWKPNHQSGYIRPAMITPDGSRIIAGHNDGHIRTYDSATGLLVQTLHHPGEVKTLRFAPDGSGRFLSGSTDRLAHVWDLQSGRKLQTFTGHTHTIIASGWSPDSRFIATASYDNTARVWEVKTGQPAGSPMLHLANLAHLEFSPDGTRLATACRDGTTRLWDPRNGQPLSPPLRQGQTCSTVRFTADSAAFFVRDHGGFRCWDTATAEPVTVHYREPVSGGFGMDSENWHAMITRDGTGVFAGYSMNYGAFWTVPQPRQPAPGWFPGFLEMLAQMRLDERGDIRLVQREGLARFADVINRAAPGDLHAAWARKVLGAAER